MAIDMNPKVGRIVVLRATTTEFFPWFMKGGKITKISGQRIYYTAEGGKETFTHGFSAIVDTKSEEGELLAFTKRGRKKFDELKSALLRERMAIHPAAYGPGGVEHEDAKENEDAEEHEEEQEPAAPVVRVRRKRAG